MPVPMLRTRKLTIIAQDPSVKINGKILRTEVEIPAEELQPGPWGYRVHTVDYDSSTETLYQPIEYAPPEDGPNGDPFKGASDADDSDVVFFRTGADQSVVGAPQQAISNELVKSRDYDPEPQT